MIKYEGLDSLWGWLVLKVLEVGGGGDVLFIEYVTIGIEVLYF